MWASINGYTFASGALAILVQVVPLAVLPIMIITATGTGSASGMIRISVTVPGQKWFSKSLPLQPEWHHCGLLPCLLQHVQGTNMYYVGFHQLN